MNINVPATTTATSGSREVIPALQEESKAITRNTAILGEQKELYDQLAERRAQAAQDMERLSGKLEEYSKKEEVAIKVRDHLKTKTEQLENAVKSYDKVVDSAIVSGSNDYLEEAKDALTSYEKELESTTAKYKHSQEAVEEYSKTTKQLREEFKQAEDTAKSCGKQMSQLEKTAGRAAQGIGSFAKTVAKFTAITLAITAVIAALEKLGKVVKRVYEN